MAKEKRSTFLKNPLDSLATHAGKFLDRMQLDDMLAIGMGAWGALHTQAPEHFLTGMIGYKLARTEGGTPPMSQVAGLGILAALGLAGFKVGSTPEERENAVADVKAGVLAQWSPLGAVLYIVHQRLQQLAQGTPPLEMQVDLGLLPKP